MQRFLHRTLRFLFPADLHLLVGDVEIQAAAEAIVPGFASNRGARRSTDISGRFALVPGKYEAVGERNFSLRNSTVRGCRQPQ